ncbi:hypothetical protein [Pseudogemmobacter humi]|uniref:hypothetical protein n=1 Tax=Pseudogemmobacter humi TaxID=2483812 RepID=UPI000F528985|nr:hypothetical protein [Pseudogemmobacter humi]
MRVSKELLNEHPLYPRTEINDPLTLSIGLSGGSGTGKTYSALLMARGIAEVVTGRQGAPILVAHHGRNSAPCRRRLCERRRHRSGCGNLNSLGKWIFRGAAA